MRTSDATKTTLIRSGLELSLILKNSLIIIYVTEMEEREVKIRKGEKSYF